MGGREAVGQILALDPGARVIVSSGYSQDPVIADRGDRISFSAPGATSFTIRFREGTPFENRVISGTGEQARIVPVLPEAAYGSYFYDASVTIGERTYVEDPEIIIRDRRMR